MSMYFIITIDTEGDNLWEVRDIHQRITTENAKYLFRFQELCEKYGFIPTYLTNYEMACDDAMIELGREGLKKKALEIGCHEHAWNSPPYYQLLKSPFHRGKPYLGEYPQRIIRQKLEYLTELLKDTFQCQITSHRGGRWCLNKTIIKELGHLGYIVDCTCTPGISWEANPGWTFGSKGTDWSAYENLPIKLTYKDAQGSNKCIMEIPVTAVKKGDGQPSWFRPDGKNLREMMGILDFVNTQGTDYIEFMIHSSELMPGGSPTFSGKGQIEYLYRDMDMLFEQIKGKGYQGIGLTDYAKKIVKEQER